MVNNQWFNFEFSLKDLLKIFFQFRFICNTSMLIINQLLVNV